MRMEAAENDVLPRGPDRQKFNDWRHRRGAFRFCPCCAADGGVHQLLWELPLVTACTAHRCRLVSRCASCGRGLEWKLLRAGPACECGHRVADMRITPASRTELAISDWLVGAAHIAHPIAAGIAGEVQISPVCRHTVKGFFDLLEWTQQVCDLLLDHLCRHRGFTVKRRHVAGFTCREPDRLTCWLVTGLPHSVDRVVRWVLRAVAKRPQDCLVYLGDGVFLHRFSQLLSQLVQSDRAIAAIVDRRIRSALHQYAAATPALPSVFFHPRFAPTQRQRVVAELQARWVRLALRLRRAGTAVGMPTQTASPRALKDWRLNPAAVQVEIMNILLHVAATRLPDRVFAPLIEHWAAPPAAFRSGVGLSELAALLSELDPAELMFVAALLRHGLEWQSS